MPLLKPPCALTLLSAALSCAAWAQVEPAASPPAVDAAAPAETDDDGTPIRQLGVVTVTGSRPTSLPTQIPTTMEGVTRQDIERSVNATDSEDALKYFPSLLVRKRYVGDYNHAILSSRASGTGNSARSAVYADGILLSNFLGNGVGGLSFPPRWGLVTPEEIERVDVMYGPFSAAYPGNSVGAVVDYVTRLPTKFEAHGKVGYVAQPFDLYGTHATYHAKQASLGLGDRAGDWAWWLNVNRTDSEGQPLTFVTRPAGTALLGTGAIPGLDSANKPWLIVGAGTQYHTVQDHLKLKLAYDFSPTVRASYVFGLWRNDADGHVESYLRDTGGSPVYGSGFNVSRERLLHTMHGLSIKSRTRGEWDWEVAASLYDYHRDDKRQSGFSTPLPTPSTLADGSGTGWNTLAFKGTWRPPQAQGRHVVEFGVQQDSYRLRYLTNSVAADYLSDDRGVQASNVQGDTRLRSLWAQDTWQFSERWKTVLGGRMERWDADNGRTDIAALPSPLPPHPARHETDFSPKAALSWQWLPQTLLKASVGRAVRYPTVNELYGATATVDSQFINDPGLRPEKSWTGELSAEQDLGAALARLTLFAEDTRDALYTQNVFDAAANKRIGRVQNVGRIATTGLEAAFNSNGWLLKGLDLWASLTYADSTIKENAGYVNAPGDTIGKRQPNIPRWRATLLASYRWDEHWTTTLGARYSGRQYRTLDNADVNGYAYMGVSKFAVADLRVLYRFDKQWSAAFGIDNLNNYQYWNFHPYPQRSYSLELKFDL
ncbi:TonB-dependent receptor [Azohydromonas australica]|uniref:TonB-dependent receptor n=1 Tax=Azohydromonas australica TaxID=364039 RepID=UPI000421082D|nr:TonB-dependent receptor [Azohydromonas australica]